MTGKAKPAPGAPFPFVAPPVFALPSGDGALPGPDVDPAANQSIHGAFSNLQYMLGSYLPAKLKAANDATLAIRGTVSRGH